MEGVKQVPTSRQADRVSRQFVDWWVYEPVGSPAGGSASRWVRQPAAQRAGGYDSRRLRQPVGTPTSASHMNVRRRPLTIFFYVFQFLILSYDIHATMCIP